MSGIYLKNDSEEQKWDREVKSENSLFDLKLKEVWDYRDLIMLFVWRDFVAQYKQTVLGPLWQFVQPALTTFIFLMFFSKVAKIPTDGISPVVFYMAGITLWNFFSNCLITISNTFITNAYIFGKVYFPRLVLPISLAISNIIKFGFQFLLLIGVMIYYHFHGYPLHFGLNLLVIPFLLIQMAALGLGLGIILSSITIKYRDFNLLLSFGLQLFIYATPIVFPLSYITNPTYRLFINLNPLTSIIESFRLALLNQGTVAINGVVYSIGFTLATLFFGILLFNKVQKTFVDNV